jgi:xanthine dehydrogenase accessory factor
MEVVVEHIQPEARLILIGAGHVAQALAPMCKAAGLRVLVIDDRDELFESPAFADHECLAYDVDELDDAVPSPSNDDYVVIVTRDHNRDERALTSLIDRPHRYIGMIASRRKVHTVVRRLLRRYEDLGRPPPDLSRVRAPIGLALGGRTPGEIAVSILAEIIAHRHGGSGEPMSMIGAVDATSDGTGDGPDGT